MIRWSLIPSIKFSAHVPTYANIKSHIREGSKLNSEHITSIQAKPEPDPILNQFTHFGSFYPFRVTEKIHGFRRNPFQKPISEFESQIFKNPNLVRNRPWPINSEKLTRSKFSGRLYDSSENICDAFDTHDTHVTCESACDRLMWHVRPHMWQILTREVWHNRLYNSCYVILWRHSYRQNTS